MSGTKPRLAAPTVPLDEAALLRLFPRATLIKGRAYAASGRVLSVRVQAQDRGGWLVEAQTRGTALRPYRQRITVPPPSDDPQARPRLLGTCTCPVGGACKHVAAALIAAGAGATPPVPASLPLPLAPPPGPAAPPAKAPLPPGVEGWLRDLAASDPGADPEAYPPTIRQRLLYLLDVAPGPWESGSGPALRIGCVVATLRKDGTFGATRPYAPHQVNTPARYLRPSDRRILRILSRLRSHQGAAGPAVEDEVPDLLRHILATGRARWGTPEGAVLEPGPPQPGRLAWQVGEDGAQRARLELADGLVGLRLPEPWYADPAAGRLGPVETGVAPALAGRLLAAPAIPVEAAPQVAAELARRLPGLNLPPPATLPPPEPLSGPPVPRLLLTLGRLPVGPMIFGSSSFRPAGAFPLREIEAPVARPSFAYGPVVLPPQPHEPPRILARSGRLYRLTRDPAAELRALQRLQSIGLVDAARALPLAAAWRPRSAGGEQWVLDAEDPDGTDWIGILLDEVPALRAEGWQVEIAEDFPVRLVAPEGDIEARLRGAEGSGIDWLELELGVVVDGERLDLVPLLVRLIAEGRGAALVEHHEDDESFLMPLADGRLLTLPIGRIRPILLALGAIFAGGGLDPEAGRIGFARHDAADLAALEEASGLAWQGGEAVRALGRQLREAGGAIPPAVLPEAFHGTLRPYQAEGVAWLQFLAAAGLGGVLADDMGLGKTVQALAHLSIEQAAGRLDRPALVVCPTSLVPTWRREAARFAPSLRVLALHGPARKERFAEIGAHDLVLSTYPLLARDGEVLAAQEWHAVLLDEAQAIRNPATEAAQQARRLRARQRLCLSGTPLQNHLGELWSVFDFLAPGFLGTQAGFRARWRTPIEKHGDSARQAALHRRLRPFLLRRTKGEVARDLPAKTEILEEVELEAGQRAIYEGVRLAMHARVRAAIAERGLARSGIVILDALLKLRQACCDPRLLPKVAKTGGRAASKAGSAKLERLMDLLAMLLAEGRRVLVFSQFTSMLALIEERLRAGGIAYEILTGTTRDRAGPVERFQSGTVPVFLVSLMAGGVGLTLTAADTVIHYDPWWNPAAEDQATDRAHRIGQDKPVFVHRLVALGTIEEKMEVLKERKRALVAAVLDAEQGGALRLTEADVEALFEPA